MIGTKRTRMDPEELTYSLGQRLTRSFLRYKQTQAIHHRVGQDLDLRFPTSPTSHFPNRVVSLRDDSYRHLPTIDYQS
ncbi:unnamed protein product [Diplocarpon coronariae]